MYKNGKPNYNEVIFTQEQLDDIRTMYEQKISSVKIGKKYHVGHHVILKALRNMGVEINQAKMVRKYSIDETFFDVIDAPEKAYILGLFYADGCNCADKSTITISLQEEDKTLLETIRVIMHSEKPLEYLDYSNKHDYGYHYKNQYRFIAFSKHLCSALSALGVVPNKSLITTFPDEVPLQLISHFIRGVYDGDGSVHRAIKNEHNHAITVTITATKMFCEGLKTVVEDTLGISGKIYDASCHNGITSVFTLSGRNISKIFLDWIYADATIYLSRKFELYLDYYDINKSLIT